MRNAFLRHHIHELRGPDGPVFYGLNYLVFSVWYRFPEFTQRIFKCDDTQNTRFASDKELNILVYRTPSCVVIYRIYILSNMVRFLAHPVYNGHTGVLVTQNPTVCKNS